MKPWYHGKFVKKTELNVEIPSIEELQRRNVEIDKCLLTGDYNSLVSTLTLF